MTAPNVLPLFSRPRETDYRAAVAKIIRDLKAQHNLSNTALAEEIGCCPETVSNAENENNSLSPVALGNIRWRFGPEATRPWDDICDARYNEPETLADKLDAIQRQINAVRKVVEA